MLAPVLLTTLLAAVPGPTSGHADAEPPNTPSTPSGPSTPNKGTAHTARGTKGAKTEPAAAQALERVQRYYDATRDYAAEFTQIYTRTALSRTSESSGTVMIKKPGMMRWAYKKPAEKLFVSDGHQLFIYEPEEQQVIIDPHFNTQELSTSISFLWGQGKLTDAFDATLGAAEKYGAPAGTNVLELTPRKDATYTKLVLVFEPRTSQVIESILYETTGNINDFKFKSARINTDLKNDLFSFTPPPDVEIIRRP